MEYTFDNISDIVDNNSLKGYSCTVEENPLSILQEIFDEMKKEYVRARNVTTDMFLDDYGEEEGTQIMNSRYPKPINIDELANQAKIIANKYEICGTTLIGNNPGFIVKIPNVRVRVRTYCNLGDYYCWIQKFGIDKFMLKIYQAMPNEEGYLIFGTSSYPHPHIAGESPCLGSYESVIKNCAGHFNMVGLLSNIKTYLNSYYGRSVFLRVAEFRPITIQTLPIDLLKEYPAKQISLNSYFNTIFKDSKIPDYDTDEYKKAENTYFETYKNNIESIELKPHDSNFYCSMYDSFNFQAIFTGIVQKVRLMMSYFNIDNYYHMYALLTNHCNSLSGTPIKWGEKYEDYESAWNYIHRTCIEYHNTQYRIGYGSGISIYPDDKIDDTGLIAEAVELNRLIYPQRTSGQQKIIKMACNNFWKHINKFKTTEDFLTPQDDYDERKDEVIKEIDNLYPKVVKWNDNYARKILINLDKQRRRLQNGLKHTIPTSNAHQLSFEALSQD